MLTIYIGTDEQENDELIQMAIYAANCFPDTVVALSCGSEFLLRTGEAAIPFINSCLQQVRASNISQPIGIREISSSLFT